MDGGTKKNVEETSNPSGTVSCHLNRSHLQHACLPHHSSSSSAASSDTEVPATVTSDKTPATATSAKAPETVTLDEATAAAEEDEVGQTMKSEFKYLDRKFNDEEEAYYVERKKDEGEREAEKTKAKEAWRLSSFVVVRR